MNFPRSRHGQRGGMLFKLMALLSFVLLCLAMYLVRHPIYRFVGESWVVEDPLEKADALIVLSDDNFYADRATRAAELFRQGQAPLVVASGRIGREGCGYAMITGQGNGQGAREQGQKCDQLPGNRDITNPEHRKFIAGIWGVPEESIPQKGLSAVPLVEAIHDGRIKGLISICFNPAVSLPDGNFVREAQIGRAHV